MGLEVKNLSKMYGKKTVVDDLSFSIDKPGVYALLGTNGAGKTTSIRMILDMLDKDAGSVLWNGKPLSFADCNIGYLAEERGLYPKYSLLDQIMYFASLRDVPAAVAKDRVAKWAKKLEVEEYIYPTYPVSANSNNNSKSLLGGLASHKAVRPIKPKKADQLSKGNQQKIQFLITMISDPELIILDEPFSGLDPVNTDILKSVIREQIASGKYIIMSSHQMEAVEEFCTDITILVHSKPVVQGNLNEIKKSYGRVNLNLKVEQDISSIIRSENIQIISEKEYEYRLKVTGDEQANSLLKKLLAAGISIIKFDLSELSLHEIFVREVGAQTNENEQKQ